MDIKIIEDEGMPKDQILVGQMMRDQLFDAYRMVMENATLIDRKTWASIIGLEYETGVKLSEFKFTDWKWEV